MKVNKSVSTAMLSVAVAVLAMHSGIASAADFKISNFFTGMGDEAKIIVPIILKLFAGVGVFFAAWGVISAISTKKQQQPLTWQLFAVIGGAVAVVIPVIILAAAGSATNGEGDAESTLSDLGVSY